ncbi:MAG: ThiF family adenylyltransferase [Pseudomonadota bacterium]
MTLLDVVIQDRHEQELRALLTRPDSAEAAAYVLFGKSAIRSDPWERRSRDRLTSYEVLPIPPSDLVSASGMHITWSTDSFVRLLRRAADEHLVAGIVHSHPQGPDTFSPQDDSNERDLLQLAKNRNGASECLLSLLWIRDGILRARYWYHSKARVDAQFVSVIGRKMYFHRQSTAAGDLEAFARQSLLFGPQFTAQLRHMRIAVVGCGGTGSATAQLLARLGVGQLLLIDEDIVDVTNLNRLHGARRSDADGMRAKVDVLAREISNMALGTRTVALRSWVGAPENRDALKSCDAIFGCTDDHDGRLLLNRLAYFYLIPVFDMGLAIEPGIGGRAKDFTGRVTILGPGAPCLMCREIVDPVTARDECLRRQEPEEYERRKREGYVRGAGNPAPVVVTFTTATACLAIDELLQCLTGFRGNDQHVWQRTRRFDVLADRRPGANQNPHCPICMDTTYWGLADIDPFLDRTG